MWSFYGQRKRLEMSDACEREQRSEKCASPKTASATASMTLASTALESQSHNTAGQQQQQEISSMASGSTPSSTAPAAGRQQQQQLLRPNESDMRELREIIHLLWGDSVREDVFKRWSQGFEFSDVEPSALVQKQGGPCAVIAPVQAYLLKIIIMEMPGIQLTKLPSDKCQSLLIEALCNILKNCRAPRYKIVTLQRRSTKERRLTPPTDAIEAAVEAEETIGIDAAGKAAPAATVATKNDAALVTTRLNLELTPDQFHERLHTLHFEHIAEVARYYVENYSQLSNTYGVLLFMYSVFLTKGTEQVTSDISDTSEPLIHSTYGYGAQSLINLMLTGRAVAHVWDNEQDVGGLKLRGICEQSDIGFITLMEQMRYCTVGSFFKNPRYPVWVMGSDTHLTVLFSNEKRLVSPETPSETGRRVFKSYDPEGNNFISSTLLRDVLAALNLVSEPGYVSLMQKRLDPENLGIILLNAFMDEFFPLERRSTPDTFELLHYNGIPGSNDNNKVRYYCGSAILLEGDLKSICTSNPMVTCLQTKWPNIEINWHDAHMPSLN
ncbi:ubiquitin carboxyl-terminal hydrolase MINDY-3 homolog [Drosophila novamexicana]|uniref:ubiquitin carboxyl-terminal hydrolase MINDY-3 homolog n=1 Tax=Drosophila novamexicana TaxID=47314 RepID=UPI0011E5925A|nr:ubiquitin carboxyl-terminal hydrolase MINDY-3 homolog [Drosophila novamexicana]